VWYLERALRMSLSPLVLTNLSGTLQMVVAGYLEGPVRTLWSPLILMYLGHCRWLLPGTLRDP
jgi:hypothetical protein